MVARGKGNPPPTRPRRGAGVRPRGFSSPPGRGSWWVQGLNACEKAKGEPGVTPVSDLAEGFLLLRCCPGSQTRLPGRAAGRSPGACLAAFSANSEFLNRVGDPKRGQCLAKQAGARKKRWFRIGARTAMSAGSWHQIRFARTRLSALLFARFLNPPAVPQKKKRANQRMQRSNARDERRGGSGGAQTENSSCLTRLRAYDASVCPPYH